MSDKAKWNGFGFVRPRMGRAKLSASAPIYRGRWVDLVEVWPEHVIVFIHPTERTFHHDEIDRITIDSP